MVDRPVANGPEQIVDRIVGQSALGEQCREHLVEHVLGFGMRQTEAAGVEEQARGGLLVQGGAGGFDGR